MSKEQKSRFQGGTLYLCATPIGNMEDITLRALRCLQEADVVAVENPARSRKLMRHYGIRRPLIAYREDNRERAGRQIVERLKEGQVVALVTDAGVPAISDPGHHLLRLLQAEGLPYSLVPGPSAALAALLLSGYPAGKFVFWGFLSRKAGRRRQEIQLLAAEEKTVVLYESPHRLQRALQDMADILGERELAVCRELTKLHEEVVRGSAAELAEWCRQHPPRGEIALVLSPREAKGNGGKDAGGENEREKVRERLRRDLAEGMPPTRAVSAAARDSALTRSEVYDLYLSLQRGSGENGGGDIC